MALALYVAWPSEEGTGQVLRRALDHALAGVPGDFPRRLVSVLIDATGTPPASDVGALLADADRYFEIAPDLEATLSIDARAAPDLGAYGAAGVNRVALRAAALDRTAQAVLAEAAALFPKCALDLSFGRPGQSLAGWRQELDLAVQLGADHISIEEHVAGEEGADADSAAGFYRAAIDLLSAAGLPPYEIAHFARAGDESRHLLHGATGGDYLGIGPGGVGRITIGGVCYALHQIEPTTAWLQAVEMGAEAERWALRPDDRRTELLLTGLRLRKGVARAWFEPMAGPLEAALDTRRLAVLIEDGFLVLDRQGLRLTERGWPLCDGVLARLLD